MDSVFRITETINEPKQLTYSVLQVTQMLSMLNAELARILEIQYGDIGKIESGKTYL